MDVLRILAVDDEPGMRSGIERILRKYNFSIPQIGSDVSFEILTAESGEEAISIIEKTQPDIMLLDHKLPGMTGLDVLEKIGRREQLFTIMITAYASLETAVLAVKRGAYDFLAKPFTPQELKASVRKAAEGLMHIRQARALAEEKRQARFQFISVLAHELKAPLNAVEGYLNIIHDRAAGDDEAAYEQMLDRCTIRIEGMRKLIVDLLDLTRIESGRKRRELSQVNLTRIVQESIETSLPAAKDKDVTITFERTEPLEMQADRGELGIIMNNLVSNAVKYNKDGGSVKVELYEVDDEVRIYVSDTGIGLSEEECKKLFQDFVRIKNEHTRNIQGSGLGLSILKKLASLYGGEVSVESAPGEGSTFSVTLMKDSTAHAAEQAEKEEAEEKAAEGGESPQT